MHKNKKITLDNIFSLGACSGPMCHKPLEIASTISSIFVFFNCTHYLGHIASSNTNFFFRISTKHQLQNFNQTSTSRLNLKSKILTKPCFRISTKYQPNSSLKILPQLQLQNIDQTQVWTKIKIPHSMHIFIVFLL